MRFPVQVDFSQIPVKNVVPESSGTAPANPIQGQLWDDTGSNTLKRWNGTAWVAFASGSTVTAASVTYAGSTNLSAANVEAALDELDTEKAPVVHQHYASQVIWTGIEPNQTVDEALNILSTTTLDQQSVAANVNFEGYRITNLGTPTASTDAATKQYVDGVAQGLSPKQAARVLLTANVNLASPGATLDGVAMSVGDRFVANGQTTGSQNGIYIWNGAASAATRAPDADTAARLTGAHIFITEGTHQDTGWVMSTDNIVLGTTSLTFVPFSGSGTITAGAGMTKTGTTLDVVGTANRITVAADSIDISTAYVGQTSITTLGTITSGTWSATAIAVARGGTGATDAATARTNLGVGSDAAAGTASMRTLGTGATQAAAGNHGHALTDANITGTLPIAQVPTGTTGTTVALGNHTHALTDATITGTLAVTKGGTGSTTAAGARTNLGAAGLYKQVLGALTAGTWTTVTHNLNTDSPQVAVIDVSTTEMVMLDWKVTGANTIQVKSDIAFAASALRLSVIG